MNENLAFYEIDGERRPADITVYALSTCGFCKRGLQFLRDNSIAFRYIYVDDLDSFEKNKLKEDLATRFGTRVGFPFVVINGERCIAGFKEDEWTEEFLG